MASTLKTRDQVCDRCRKLKKGCIGAGSQCSNCLLASVQCETTAVLKRKRKPKPVVHPVELENQRLKEKIAALTEKLTILESKAFSPSQNQTETRQPVSDKTQLIGHLGRLLPTEEGQIFAGSSTGVYFIDQVHQDFKVDGKLQYPMEYIQSSYAAYRNETETLPPLRDDSNIDTIMRFLNGITSINSKVGEFFRTWDSVYPILHKSVFLKKIEDYIVFTKIPELSMLYSLLVILSIQAASENDTTHAITFSLSQRLLPVIMASDSFGTLQCYLLSILYLQLIGNHGLCIQFNGMSVRLAFLLGLHRHSQRFKFDKLTTESRKKCWWCVYCFDMFTSCYNGTPKLIRDDDVDTDLPLEINDVLDMDDNIALPLPGEQALTSRFISIIKLAKCVSSVLKNLYTTTQRRNGATKMEMLKKQLSIWKDNNLVQDDQDYPQSDLAYCFMVLTYYITLIHINRPGLTFQKGTESFKKSAMDSRDVSRELIAFYKSCGNNDFLYRLYPCGCHIIFQSALFLLWHRWLVLEGTILDIYETHPSPALFTVDNSPNMSDDQELIIAAISILQQKGNSSKPTIESAKVLERLLHLTFNQTENIDVSYLDNLWIETYGFINEFDIPLSFLDGSQSNF